MSYPNLVVNARSGLQFVSRQDIISCRASGNYTTIMLKNGQQHVVSKKLKVIESHFTDDHFFRIHHSHLINLQHLVSMKNDNDLRVTMTDGSELEVSKRKRRDFMALFQKL